MFLLLTMDDPRHAELMKELAKDVEAYTTGTNNAFPISDKLAASIARWPVATEEFIVYRGQSADFPTLPSEVPFFSTSLGLDVAKTFADYAKKGQVFMIKIQPGVRFLVVSLRGEAEIFVESGGVAEYGKKVRASQRPYWAMAVPVIYGPPPASGGRRNTRRRKRRTTLRGSSKAGRSGR